MYKTLKNKSDKLNQVIFLREIIAYSTGRYDVITEVSSCYLVPPSLIFLLLICREEVTD